MKAQELEQRLMRYLDLRRALGTTIGSDSKVLESFVASPGAKVMVEP